MFKAQLTFVDIGKELASAEHLLKNRRLPWIIDGFNAPFLAGKASQPTPAEYAQPVRLTSAQAFAEARRTGLPQDWTETESIAVIGDVSHHMIGMDVLVARTRDFKAAGTLAARVGYRPALAGEFLQVLHNLSQEKADFSGWFLCYSGRKPGYAILADYVGGLNQPLQSVRFDTYIGNQIEEGHIEANADTYCIFVPHE